MRDGEVITLPAKAFDLLTFLVENTGRVVTRDEIFDVAFLILIGAGAIWFYKWRGGQQKTVVPSSERQMTTQIFTTEGGGILWRVAFSPDSKNLVYSGGNEMREIVIAENFR